MALVCADGRLPRRRTTNDRQLKTSAVHRLSYGGNRWAGRLAARPITAVGENKAAAAHNIL